MRNTFTIQCGKRPRVANLTHPRPRPSSSKSRPKAALSFLILLAFLPLLTSCAAPERQRGPERAQRVEWATLSFPTPTPAWTLTPVAAYRVANEHWCIHQLTPPDGMVMQMISEVSGTISIADPNSTGETPVRHYVLGKTWAWGDDSEITFIKSLDELAEPLKTATKLVLHQPTPTANP